MHNSCRHLQDEEEAAAGVAHDDGDDHAIDFITGSQSFTHKSPSTHLQPQVQSPLHLSQSRRIYVRNADVYCFAACLYGLPFASAPAAADAAAAAAAAAAVFVTLPLSFGLS
jgi:hypothetical protein